MTEIEDWAEQCIAGMDTDFPLPRSTARINGLSIEEAIREHVQWLRQWKNSLHCSVNEFDPAIVCRDDKCKLGQWIYSLNTSLTRTFEYQNLKLTHAQFHRLAADIIIEYRQGNESVALVRTRQHLLETSKQIVSALVDLEAINHL